MEFNWKWQALGLEFPEPAEVRQPCIKCSAPGEKKVVTSLLGDSLWRTYRQYWWGPEGAVFSSLRAQFGKHLHTWLTWRESFAWAILLKCVSVCGTQWVKWMGIEVSKHCQITPITISHPSKLPCLWWLIVRPLKMHRTGIFWTVREAWGYFSFKKDREIKTIS